MKLPKIVSNNPKETLLIFAFILLLLFVLLMRRVYAAEVVVRPGMAFGTGGLAPVLGLDGRFPQGNNFALVAGTTLWGETSRTETNWDWHGGIVTCRGSFCASLEAVYLQGGGLHQRQPRGVRARAVIPFSLDARRGCGATPPFQRGDADAEPWQKCSAATDQVAVMLTDAEMYERIEKGLALRVALAFESREFPA